MISSSKVRLIFFEQSIGCETCAATRRALTQLAESDDQVALETLNLVLDKERAAEYGVLRVPAIIVSTPECERIRYYGSPLGHEWPTLIEAITITSTGNVPLSDRNRARLGTLSTAVRLQVFFTPTCVYCPRMIVLANQLAVASPLVSAVAIDATEFPDLVHRYNVNGVPKTVINDTIEIMGAVSEDELVAALVDGTNTGDLGFGIGD